MHDACHNDVTPRNVVRLHDPVGASSNLQFQLVDLGTATLMPLLPEDDPVHRSLTADRVVTHAHDSAARDASGSSGTAT